MNIYSCIECKKELSKLDILNLFCENKKCRRYLLITLSEKQFPMKSFGTYENLVKEFMGDLMTRKTGWFETIGESKHAKDIAQNLFRLLQKIKS